MRRSRGSDWFRRTSLAGALAVAALATGGTADASVPFQVVQPADYLLSFDHVPYDVPSPTQRIRLRNITSDPASGDARVGGDFVVVSEGGGFAPGQERFWDIACIPDLSAGGDQAFFDLDWCGRDCDENSGLLTIHLSCTAGQMAPMDAQIDMPRVYAYEVSQRTVHWTNATGAAVTITGAAASDSAFSAALAAGSWPQTVLPGQSLDVVVTFDTTRPDTTANVDLLADAVVIGRVRAVGTTTKQIDPVNYNFNSVPQGSVYTLPVRVHNSSPMARTIASVTADNNQIAISGLVGITLAPGAVTEGLVSLTASTLGSLTANVTLQFDSGDSEVAQYSAVIVAPTFSVITSDAAPNDGRLDFGTWRVDAQPLQQTFKIMNRTASSRAVNCAPLTAPTQFALVGPCPATIAANASASFTIRLTPSTVGFEQSAISIALTTGGQVSLAVQLDARIVDRQLALSASKFEFPATTLGNAMQQSVTITNIASNPITLPVSITGDAFMLASDPTITLPAGGTAEVTVAFHPAAPSDYTGSLEIGAAGDLDHVALPLSGTGRASQGGSGTGDGSDPGGGGTGAGRMTGCDAGGSSDAAAGLGLLAPFSLRRRRRR